MTTEEIKKELSEFVEYDRGEQLRKELKKRGKNYKSKYSAEQLLSFIERTADSFSIEDIHAQRSGEPYVYCLFTVRSQHVYGDSLKECLDQAILKSRTKL